MSKAKHTKGNWSVSAHSKTNENGAEYLTIDCFENGSGVEGLAVVYEGVHGDPRAEMEANARLIAEAPAMLEMLQEIADKFDKDQHLLNVSPTKIKELIKKIEV